MQTPEDAEPERRLSMGSSPGPWGAMGVRCPCELSGMKLQSRREN